MIEWKKCNKKSMPEYPVVLIRVEDKSFNGSSRFELAYYDSPEHYIDPSEARGWVLCDGSQECVRGKVTHWARVTLPEGLK